MTGNTVRWTLAKRVNRINETTRHAYDKRTGLHGDTVETLCNITVANQTLDEVTDREKLAPSCRECRHRAWEITNPELSYPST